MTSNQKQLDIGPPMPIIQLTLEQDLKMRQIEDALKHAQKDDIVTVYLALQRQCFVLGNNISQLVKTWPSPLNTTETTGK